ncbi:AtzH-like domain-containing protein [Salinibaculum salinum]|uniref:AtzH-like domain-containing protein n=1 Tax=Salinibaculum salinum TaxID=3131996 RepID=UPI0030ED29FB
MVDRPSVDETPEQAIRSYYRALRNGDALAPYFSDAETTVKFGISETLEGGEAVADGLREQTATTTEWTVDSHDLVVDQRETVAWFADEVGLAWTDTEQQTRHEFDTRWSGTLERTDRWRFVGMHVSTAREI